MSTDENISLREIADTVVCVSAPPAKNGAVFMALLVMAGLGAWRGLPARARALAFGRADGEKCPQVKPLPPPSYESFFGRQLPVSGESREWQVRLVAWWPLKWPPQRFTFSVKNRVTDAKYRLTLDPSDTPKFFASQVDDIIPIRGNRAILLARTVSSMSTVYVLGLPSGDIIDKFLAFEPGISPGRRFLAFIKSFPGHPGPVSITDEYLVYDLSRGPGYNRPHFKAGVTYDVGWPVYPAGATNVAGDNLIPGLSSPVHTMTSKRLYWLRPDTLAFTDNYAGVDRLVVVSLAKGVRHPQVASVELAASRFINFSRCQKTMSPADFAKFRRMPIVGTRIAAVPGETNAVCLHVSTWAGSSACLKLKDAIVRLP